MYMFEGPQAQAEMTYRKSREQSSGAWNSFNTTLENADGFMVISVDDCSPDDTAHELSENIGGDLAPREVSAEGEGQGHSWVDVSPRNPAGYPSTQCDSCVRMIGCTDGAKRKRALDSVNLLLCAWEYGPTAHPKLIER